MLAAASMRERASRSLPSSQARGRYTWISLIPSSAMPSASGWNPGAQNASKQCTKASMPVAAVIAGGRPTVSSGSLITTPGIICGWKMIFFWWVASLTTTPARPTSEPVPAVVGTAMIGAIPRGSARVHQSPTSSKSHSGRVCPDMKAITLPASSAEPPPKAITPS